MGQIAPIGTRKLYIRAVKAKANADMLDTSINNVIDIIGSPLQENDSRIPDTTIASKQDVDNIEGGGGGGSDCTDDGISYGIPKREIPYLSSPYDDPPFFPEDN